jgi:hypothetical protein
MNFFKIKPKVPVQGGITATNKGGFIPAMGSKIKQLFTGQKTTTGPGKVTIPAQPGKTIYSGGYPMRVPPSAARTVDKMGPPQVTTQLAPFGPGGPTNQNIYAALQRGIIPTVGAGGKVLSAVKPYTGSIVIAGTMYSVLKPDGTPKSVEELSAESGADGNKIIEKVKEKITTGGTGDGIELSDKEKRAQQIQKYRDIMDIKGMNKEAAYDSLIAASQAVNQAGGDLKGAIKDGSLINQIIQSTSKAFDKPKQTKDAIDTLILKGEIEKDIKASDPTAQQKAKLTEKQIQIADKTLAGDSFSDIITERYKKGKVPRGDELAGILRATEGVDVTTIDSTKIPSGVDPQTFFESQIKESKKAGTPVSPGYYVISDRVLIVDVQGNVTPLL